MQRGNEIGLAVQDAGKPAYLYRDTSGVLHVALDSVAHGSPLIGILPGVTPESLGASSMAEAHQTRYPYICGEMANGISTVEMVAAIAAEGMLGFFGAAGLTLPRIERAVNELQRRCGPERWGSNLIHSPQDPELEERSVDLYLRHGVSRVSASAFMAVRPSVVRYACRGMRSDSSGNVMRQNHVFAKISRPEVARQFLSPAPEAMLRSLVESGALTLEEASLARRVPVAEDITAEADSAGHTDNRPLSALLPAILALRGELSARFGYRRSIRVGAAGGLGTPMAVAGAFALGADYVLTGSINQCTLESGQSEGAKEMLAQAGLADIMMAPAGDMFELGVKVQVLKRGSLFPVRAAKLYELYHRYESLESVPADVIGMLERDVFRQPVESVWEQTRNYFLQRKPTEAERGDRDARHRMALIFRWYLGYSSRWPLQGNHERRIDYQIWCGPAMGAFNQWVKGSFLEELSKRTVGQIALNLMFGAASITRAHQLRVFGLPTPPELFYYIPRPLAPDFGSRPLSAVHAQQ